MSLEKRVERLEAATAGGNEREYDTILEWREHRDMSGAQRAAIPGRVLFLVGDRLTRENWRDPPGDTITVAGTR